MCRSNLILLLLGISILPTATADGQEVKLQDLSLNQLEERLEAIEAELETLASNSPRYEIGTIGFRSASHPAPHHEEWFQVDLGKDQLIDQVVLVPTLWHDTRTGLRADGFPKEFRILTGASGDSEGEVVARFSKEDHLQPRIAPLVVSCPGVTASWIRIEATILSPRAWDGRHLLQLSEIMVFSGPENVALRQGVSVSSGNELPGRARAKETLVDGSTPFLMDAARGEQSIAFFSLLKSGSEPSFTLDLGASQPVERVHLHTLELSDTVPQVSPPGMGIPRKLVVTGANQADFSDAVPLCEFIVETIFDTGAIMMRRFPPTECRYLKLSAIDPFTSTWDGTSQPQIGYSEIGIFAGGQNVAVGKDIEVDFAFKDSHRSLKALTDGLNLYGTILPIRDWMEQLARRHDLETERPLVLAELDKRYEHQKAILNRMIWLTVLLAAGIVIVILIDRIFRMRQVTRIKERFAADLHDEVGANLHAIALLSDVAKDKVGEDEELSEIIDEVRAISLETTTATRNCTSMLEAKGICEDLTTELKRTAKRLLIDLEHEIEITGAEHLQQLSPRRGIDLLLFHKECLVNIIRHSQATRVVSSITADRTGIDLIVSDNGIGISRKSPPSLRRRARLLGAKVKIESPPSGGTRVALKLRTRKFSF